MCVFNCQTRAGRHAPMLLLPLSLRDRGGNVKHDQNMMNKVNDMTAPRPELEIADNI